MFDGGQVNSGDVEESLRTLRHDLVNAQQKIHCLRFMIRRLLERDCADITKLKIANALLQEEMRERDEHHPSTHRT
jgi:hypothetical protein